MRNEAVGDTIDLLELAKDNSVVGREFVWKKGGNLYKGVIKRLYMDEAPAFEVLCPYVDLEWGAIKVVGSSSWAVVEVPESIALGYHGEVHENGIIYISDCDCMILPPDTYYPPKRVIGKR